MKTNFINKSSAKVLVIVLTERLILGNNLSDNMKKAANQIISAGRFKGKFGTTDISVIDCDNNFNTVILLGAGEAEKFDILTAQKLGGKLVTFLKSKKISEASVLIEESIAKNAIYANMAYGAELMDYDFDKYKSPKKLEDKTYLTNIDFLNSSKEIIDIYADLYKIAESVHFTRDLVSEPANILYPKSYAERIKELENFGIKVEILGEKELKEKGFGALLAVGEGSDKESKLVVMQYNGGNQGDSPLAFVGKGVCFDTGGISIKPSESMEDMKYDMAGSAVVVGLIRSLAMRKAKVNVVGIVGLVENMPGSKAYRPADILKSLSGQTIEVLNTDAEGRLVLADALWYTQDRFKPKFIIDLATLTGAVVIALGHEYAGIFSNDDILSSKLYDAGIRVEEKIWRFPLHDNYDKDIDSVIADVRNTQKTSRAAGSITAAHFLKRFVNNVPWVHIDIAGVAWDKKGGDFCPIGATGFGVRLLNEFIKSNYE